MVRLEVEEEFNITTTWSTYDGAAENETKEVEFEALGCKRAFFAKFVFGLYLISYGELADVC